MRPYFWSPIVLLALSQACGGDVLSVSVSGDAGLDAEAVDGEAASDGGAGSDGSDVATACIPSLYEGTGTQPTPIISDLDPVVGVAVHENFLVYSTLGQASAIKRAPLEGGAPVVLSTASGPLKGITVCDGWVYWVAQGVWRAPIEVGTSELVVDDDVSSFACADGFLYWATPASINRAPVAGGAAEVISESHDTVVSIAVNSDHVYWLEEGKSVTTSDYTASPGMLARAALVGGSREEITPIVTPHRLAMHSAKAYVTSGGTFSGANSQSTGVVWEISSDSHWMSSHQENPSALAVDDTSAYWMNIGGGTAACGGVYRVDLNEPNSSTTKLGGATGDLAYEMGEIALTADFVYWSDFGGRKVWRASKQ